MSEEKTTALATVELTPKVIRDYFCKLATEQEIGLFINICKVSNLNPFKREAYLIKYGTAPATIVTGYETYLRRAENNPNYGGFKVWCEGSLEDDSLKACINVYRKDWIEPLYWEAPFNECVQKTSDGRPNRMWINRPTHMLKKTVIAQGLRLAFSKDVEGLPYTSDEMGVETTPITVIEPLPEQNKPQTVKEKVKESKDPKVNQELKDANTQMPPVKEMEANGEKPIDIYVEVVGGSGRHANKVWIEVPEEYLNSLRDEKYWNNIPPRKQKAILDTLEYLANKQVDQEQVSEGDFTFDNTGDTTTQVKPKEAPLPPEPEPQKTTTVTLSQDMMLAELVRQWVAPEIKKDEGGLASVTQDQKDFLTMLYTSKLFTDTERMTLNQSLQIWNYNTAILQTKIAIAQFKQRYKKAYKTDV